MNQSTEGREKKSTRDELRLDDYCVKYFSVALNIFICYSFCNIASEGKMMLDPLPHDDRKDKPI